MKRLKVLHLLVRNFTFKTWEWILGDKNGNYQDAKKIIDLIQEYDEELAKDILEQTDKDPARIQYKYKQKLKRHIDKKKEDWGCAKGYKTSSFIDKCGAANVL